MAKKLTSKIVILAMLILGFSANYADAAVVSHAEASFVMMQDGGDAGEPKAEEQTDFSRFVDIFIGSFRTTQTGWQFMWIILLCAVFMIAIAIERVYFIMVRSNINAPKFMAEIRKLVAGGNYKKAIALCETAKNKALPYVVLAGLKRASESEHLDFRAIQNAVDEGTLEIIPRLNERTGYLAMIGNVATLIGLTGTVFGLILAFAAVGAPGIPEDQKSLLLANGIAAAMGTTIAGLFTAIPAIVINTIIITRTSKIVDELDEHMVKLINLITGNR